MSKKIRTLETDDEVLGVPTEETASIAETAELDSLPAEIKVEEPVQEESTEQLDSNSVEAPAVEPQPEQIQDEPNVQEDIPDSPFAAVEDIQPPKKKYDKFSYV